MLNTNLEPVHVPHSGEHGHGHGHEHAPIISKRWKWATVLGNLAVGLAEIALGNTNTLSVTADGVHNGGDAVAYQIESTNVIEREKMQKDRLRRRRKLAHTVIAACSGAVAAKAGYDIYSGHESAHSPLSLYAASASLTLNAGLYGTMLRGIRRKARASGTIEKTEAERDLNKHMLYLDIPSAAAAVFGATAQKYNVGLEQVTALASGAWGAYLFRPTDRNLDAHNHSHGEESHELEGHDEHAEDLNDEKPLRASKWHEKLSSHVYVAGMYVADRIKYWSASARYTERMASEPHPACLRRAKLGVTAVAGVALGATLWKYSQGGYTPDASTVDNFRLPEVAPEATVPSPVLPIKTDRVYSREASTVSPGEGWRSTFYEMGIAADKHDSLLENIKDEMLRIRDPHGAPVAYLEEFDGQRKAELRMTMPIDGVLDDTVLDFIAERA